ncbi:hypothetical protein PRZ48_008622 [Zasmidium cellare]|uniref:Uncharacterized protein n=1 Tax=Zasmidium cellare TaxID=395010 RepID=A0ABR0EGU8_ZASCE|nr:hypothetical protein PRZ48_008622 [Zasmidium cellare]
MIALSENVCKASKAVIDDRILPGVHHTGMSTHSGTQRSRWDSQYLITIYSHKREKYFPLKVCGTMDARTVAEMVAMHEGMPAGQVLLRDRDGNVIYRRGVEGSSPVKGKQLAPAKTGPGDLVTLHVNGDLHSRIMA